MTDTSGNQTPNIQEQLGKDENRRWVDLLAQYECPALTARRARRSETSGANQDPIVWKDAFGCNVRDVNNNVYVDLTAGFGVASVGHRHPSVVDSIQKQSGHLLHGMGDVFPSTTKIELLEKLARIAPWPNAKVMLGLNGSDAVAAALKTAALQTGKPGILAFEGSYHGLFYGPLSVSHYKDSFRKPFETQLNPNVVFAPWPNANEKAEEALLRIRNILEQTDVPLGAIIYEPVQARGGVCIPPPGFLLGLRTLADEFGLVLIADEIFTGLGRCLEHRDASATSVTPKQLWKTLESKTTPDILCTGKALGGGMPISACIAKEDVMQAWGNPVGEAIHTATFQGHPLSCASALATLNILDDPSFFAQSTSTHAWFKNELEQLMHAFPQIQEIRAAGMLFGVAFDSSERTLSVVQQLLESGYITLPAGEGPYVVQLSPPLNISRKLLQSFITCFKQILREM